MPKRPLYIDSAGRRVAADVHSVGECDALIKRFTRNISEIDAKLLSADPQEAVRLKHTRFFKHLVLTSLRQRRNQITRAEHLKLNSA